MRVLLKAAVALFLSGLVLDYRGDGDSGTSILQYLFFGISVASGLLAIFMGLKLSGGRLAADSRAGVRIVWSSLVFCAWAPIAVVVSSDTGHGDFISVILPYFLYAQAILVVLVALQGGIQERTVVRTLITVSAISCAWRLFYAVTVGGVDLNEARWQILSPTLPLILGASVAALSTGINRKLALLGLFYFLAIIALSVTRGYLLSLAAMIAASFITAKWRTGRAHSPRSIAKKLLVLGAAGFALIGMSLLMPDDVRSRWADRLTGERSDGQEITLLIRLAEYKGMYDDLTQRRSTLLAGRGFGARYAYDDDLISVLEFVDPAEGLGSTNGADSTWGYPIFAHGIIVGTIFLVGLLAAVFVSFKRCQPKTGPTRAPFITHFIFFSLAAFMGVSLTSNILNERLGGVVVGALVALALGAARARPPSLPSNAMLSLPSA